MKIIEQRELCDIVEVAITDPVFGFYLGICRLSVHPESKCKGRPCTIHNPSDHALAACEQLWRSDLRMMERICEHGVGHPDPDGLRTGSVHGCDGCCSREVSGANDA